MDGVGVVVYVWKIGTQQIAADNIDVDNTWDDVHMLCPNQCVCQHAPLMDLSIARWIQDMRHEQFDDSITSKTANGEKITSNEVRRQKKKSIYFSVDNFMRWLLQFLPPGLCGKWHELHAEWPCEIYHVCAASRWIYQRFHFIVATRCSSAGAITQWKL